MTLKQIILDKRTAKRGMFLSVKVNPFKFTSR